MCFGGGGGDQGGGGGGGQQIVYVPEPTYNPYYTISGEATDTTGGAGGLLGGTQGQQSNYVPTTPWEGQSYNYVPGAAMQLLRMRNSPQYLW